VKRILKRLALTAVILLCFGDIGAQAAKTVGLTNGERQPFLSKDAPRHGFASFSDATTTLEGGTIDLPGREFARLSCRAS